jgi:hypothetical protein
MQNPLGSGIIQQYFETDAIHSIYLNYNKIIFSGPFLICFLYLFKGGDSKKPMKHKFPLIFSSISLNFLDGCTVESGSYILYLNFTQPIGK